MKSYHKTIQIYLTDSQDTTIDPDQMDELIGVALGLLGVHFPPLALSSVAVYDIPNYKSGRIQHFLTVVAQEQEAY
jgi:hypothetical protein